MRLPEAAVAEAGSGEVGPVPRRRGRRQKGSNEKKKGKADMVETVETAETAEKGPKEGEKKKATPKKKSRQAPVDLPPWATWMALQYSALDKVIFFYEE